MMSQSIEDALLGIQEAAKADGIPQFFVAIRDPDSDRLHCRIHGGMNAGFAMAHQALAGNSIPFRMEHAPALHKALDLGLPAAGVQTWFFCFRREGGDLVSPLAGYACPEGPQEAYGLGVACLHLMVRGHIKDDFLFTPGPPGT